MSQENVGMVRGLWEPFKGVDATAVDWDDEAIREMTERFWSPEVELRWTRSGPETRVYQGSDGVIQAFRECSEGFSEYYVSGASDAPADIRLPSLAVAEAGVIASLPPAPPCRERAPQRRLPRRLLIAAKRQS